MNKRDWDNFYKIFGAQKPPAKTVNKKPQSPK